MARFDSSTSSIPSLSHVNLSGWSPDEIAQVTVTDEPSDNRAGNENGRIFVCSVNKDWLAHFIHRSMFYSPSEETWDTVTKIEIKKRSWIHSRTENFFVHTPKQTSKYLSASLCQQKNLERTEKEGNSKCWEVPVTETEIRFDNLVPIPFSAEHS